MFTRNQSKQHQNMDWLKFATDVYSITTMVTTLFELITSSCCATLPLDWNGTAVTNTLQTNSTSRWITEGSEPILEMNLSSIVLIDASLSAL